MNKVYCITVKNSVAALNLSPLSVCRPIEGGLVGFDAPETGARFASDGFGDGGYALDTGIPPRELSLTFEVTARFGEAIRARRGIHLQLCREVCRRRQHVAARRHRGQRSVLSASHGVDLRPHDRKRESACGDGDGHVFHDHRQARGRLVLRKRDLKDLNGI